MRSYLFLFLILLPWAVNAQKLHYDVILMDKKIGTMVVSKIPDAGGERYLLSSETSAKVLFIKQDSKIAFDVLYKGGHLISSMYKSEKKDDNILTHVEKNDAHYKVSYNNKLSYVKNNITFSSIQLYFREPVGVSSIFVERIGNFLTLKKNGSNEYEYLQPDGTRSIYRYQNGKLKEVELKRSMGSVYIRPVQA